MENNITSVEKYSIIKNYGYEEEILKKQLEKYNTNKEKITHLEIVYKKIREIGLKIDAIIRLINIKNKKIREIEPEFVPKIMKDDLIASINQFEKEKLSERELNDLFKRVYSKKQKQVTNLYYGFVELLIKKFSNKNITSLILDNIINNNKDDTFDKRFIAYRKHLWNIKKEMKQYREFILQEGNKYETFQMLVLENENEKDFKKFKNFRRGELKKELKKYIKEYGLKEGVTVESKKVNLITRKLKEDGWNAKEQSVAVTLRIMGFGEELIRK